MKISLQLIDECKLGNRLSQKALYHKLLPYLRAVAIRYLWNKTHVKDVLQESFILIFQNINQYDSTKGAFHKWAVRITINSTLNYNKRKTVRNEDPFEIDLHDIPDKALVLENLSAEDSLIFLKKMPKSYFQVFNLFVIDEYSHKEISHFLNISIELSRKRLSRARTWITNFSKSQIKIQSK